MSAECTMPPEGWRCTRGAGHDGPCAAVPMTEHQEERVELRRKLRGVFGTPQDPDEEPEFKEPDEGDWPLLYAERHQSGSNRCLYAFQDPDARVRETQHQVYYPQGHAPSTPPSERRAPMLRKLIEWRREQLALKLADLNAYVSKWGWSHKPSHKRELEKRITRAECRLARFNEKHPEYPR